MTELLTYGDIVLEASLDDLSAEEFFAQEHPSRFERVDWTDKRPSMQYLQVQFDYWSKRLSDALEEFHVFVKWGIDVPDQLMRCVNSASKQQDKYYLMMINHE